MEEPEILKDVKNEICQQQFDYIEPVCKEYHLNLLWINPRQIRIQRGKDKLDIYPLSNRCCVIMGNKWGNYLSPVDKVKEHFNLI